MEMLRPLEEFEVKTGGGGHGVCCNLLKFLHPIDAAWRKPKSIVAFLNDLPSRA